DAVIVGPGQAVLRPRRLPGAWIGDALLFPVAGHPEAAPARVVVRRLLPALLLADLPRVGTEAPGALQVAPLFFERCYHLRLAGRRHQRQHQRHPDGAVSGHRCLPAWLPFGVELASPCRACRPPAARRQERGRRGRTAAWKPGNWRTGEEAMNRPVL